MAYAKAYDDRIRAELADLDDDTLVITEHGTPVAVAVSVERWNGIQEALEDLEDWGAVLEHRLEPDSGRALADVAEDLEKHVPGPPHTAR